MLQTSFRKTVLGAAVIAAAAIGFAGSAQAKTVPIKWDPNYGGAFPNLGWSGNGTANYAVGCESLTGWVSNSDACSLGSMNLTGLTLNFYDIANSNVILQTMPLTSPLVYEMYFQGGALKGISSGFTAPVSSTLSIAEYGGGPVWWHMIFEWEALPAGVPSVQLYWTEKYTNPDCLFKPTPTCVGGNSAERAILTVVPEPETYALMLAGLGVVGFMAWRRRQ